MNKALYAVASEACGFIPTFRIFQDTFVKVATTKIISNFVIPTMVDSWKNLHPNLRGAVAGAATFLIISMNYDKAQAFMGKTGEDEELVSSKVLATAAVVSTFMLSGALASRKSNF